MRRFATFGCFTCLGLALAGGCGSGGGSSSSSSSSGSSSGAGAAASSSSSGGTGGTSSSSSSSSSSSGSASSSSGSGGSTSASSSSSGSTSTTSSSSGSTSTSSSSSGSTSTSSSTSSASSSGATGPKFTLLGTLSLPNAGGSFNLAVGYAGTAAAGKAFLVDIDPATFAPDGIDVIDVASRTSTLDSTFYAIVRPTALVMAGSTLVAYSNSDVFAAAYGAGGLGASAKVATLGGFKQAAGTPGSTLLAGSTGYGQLGIFDSANAFTQTVSFTNGVGSLVAASTTGVAGLTLVNSSWTGVAIADTVNKTANNVTVAFSKPQGPAPALAFSADGATVYAAPCTSPGVIAVIDVATQTLKSPLSGVSPPYMMATSLDGNDLFTIGADNKLAAVHLPDGTLTTSVAILQNGATSIDTFAVASDGTILVLVHDTNVPTLQFFSFQ